MKQYSFLIPIGLVLMTAACSHKVPVAAAPPPPPAEIPRAAPAVQAQRQEARPAPTPAPKPVQEARRPAVMSPEQRATLNEHLAKLEDALFDYDKATIRTDATVALRDDVNVIRGILNDFPAQKLIIEGHADERGSDEYNLALGDKRARAAEDFLSDMGVAQNQLTVISYGKDRPVCTDQSESCWQRNRRAHISAAP